MGNPLSDFADRLLNPAQRLLAGLANLSEAERPHYGAEISDRLRAMVLDYVGIACRTCGGIGQRTYPSTTLWRSGLGGAVLRNGVCDGCWGSGRSDVRGVDLRALEQRLAAAERSLKDRGE